ncbi:MAG: ADP-ribosylglycohydrolase family protein [Polyangiaceae bacterium]|nr:ADP-ribosylglycohydrolase family protein [Polyangiaceae bacterium]
MSSSDPATGLELCLLAGLLGDAWGGAYEGQSAPAGTAFPRIAVVSDDTQLIMATCEALIESGGRVEPEIIASRFREWFTSGRFTGLGSSTLKALRDLSAGAHWALSGARGEFAAGAGAAMRAAPLAFFLDPRLDQDRQAIRDVSRITHHSDEAYAGALAMVLAVRHCSFERRVPADLLRLVAADLPDTAVRDRMLELSGSSDKAAVQLGVSGHVVDAVPLALRIASAAGVTCEGAIRAAISCGGDTDTIAAMAAQVLGAAGTSAPNDLVDRVQDAAVARDLFSRAAALVSSAG